MATINISDLYSTGSELFSDSESYMNELKNEELLSINGGTSTLLCSSATCVIISVVSYYTYKRNRD